MNALQMPSLPAISICFALVRCLPGVVEGVVTGRNLGFVAMLGVAVFVAAGVALHFLDTDLDPVEVYMSDYALGPYGWLMKTAFWAVGLGTVALGLGLRSTLAPGKRVTPSVVLVLVAGIGFLVVGSVDTDPYNATEGTTTGSIHLMSALILFICLVVSAWLLRGVFARDPNWTTFSRPALWFAVALTITFVIQFAGPLGAGLQQRIFVVVMMSWLALLGWQVAQRGATAT
jgi:hypothetical membrane protein